ncbi:lipid asymmetry maintenance protein MlaB [Zoogloea sp.]|uniref:STAS domain-containing protein n=1 Tax=Zoogloea sp. TaxID=49181 RepID=UPI0035B05A31
MIREDGARLALEGPLTLVTVAPLAEAGRGLVAAADRVVDLSAVTQVDSSALALLLSWTRVARGAGRQLSIAGAPAALVSLASLYDVDTILPLGR